jgi:CheY-like chemotaxis protein
LIRRVRAMGSAVPAIAVTAFAHPDDRQRAIASGYSQYCAKPIDGPLVARALRDILPRR